MLGGTEFEWSGRTVPISGSVADCPDNIYRLAPIDPDSRVRGEFRKLVLRFWARIRWS